jgi:hypothetical protein
MGYISDSKKENSKSPVEQLVSYVNRKFSDEGVSSNRGSFLTLAFPNGRNW